MNCPVCKSDDIEDSECTVCDGYGFMDDEETTECDYCNGTGEGGNGPYQCTYCGNEF